jgi:hypothetical protein
MRAKDEPPYCIVIWDDAWSDSVGVATLKDVGELHKASRYETRGWVLIDNERGISIFPERCLDDGEVSYRGRTFIPRSLVISNTPIKVRTHEKTPRARKPAPSDGI